MTTNDIKILHESIIGRNIPLKMEFEPKDLTFQYAHKPYIDQRVPIWEMYDGKGALDFSKQYFTMEALSDGTIYFRLFADNDIDYIAYSKNSDDWVITNNDDEGSVNIKINVSKGDIIKWKGLGSSFCNSPQGYSTISNFASTCDVNIYGNIMSLLCEQPVSEFIRVLPQNSSRFGQLFSGGYVEDIEDTVPLKVISAENLIIPCETAERYMCTYMFHNCTSLTTAPSILPATTLTEYCYSYMFQGCTSLTAAPALPATTLAENCYYEMFYGCTSLTIAPALPATTLANYCYCDMFGGCTSLTTAPELPATTLADYCYQHMFNGCTSLTTAPELPATTLVYCCYDRMFYGCGSLNYIKCLATDIEATNCTGTWVSDVAPTGTFVKNPNMSSWETGSNGIPSGWTVENFS